MEEAHRRSLLLVEVRTQQNLANEFHPDCTGVVKVAGDGDCLFHALAFFDGSDGGALRIDVADFMEQEAVNQPAFEAEWLDEAERLRHSKWWGHTAIIAFVVVAVTG